MCSVNDHRATGQCGEVSASPGILADCRMEMHVTEMQPAIIPNVGPARLWPPVTVLRKMDAGAAVISRQECCGHHRLRIAQAIAPPGNMSRTNDPGSVSERQSRGQSRPVLLRDASTVLQPIAEAAETLSARRRESMWPE
jgi:hypothetical protein